MLQTHFTPCLGPGQRTQVEAIKSCMLTLLRALVTAAAADLHPIHIFPLHSCHMALVLTWSLLDNSNRFLSRGSSSASPTNTGRRILQAQLLQRDPKTATFKQIGVQAPPVQLLLWPASTCISPLPGPPAHSTGRSCHAEHNHLLKHAQGWLRPGLLWKPRWPKSGSALWPLASPPPQPCGTGQDSRCQGHLGI